MRVLRGLGGAVTWLLAAVLGLVGIILCVTILLIPLGLLVLRAAKALFAVSMRLMLPRAVTHPVEELDKGATELRRRLGSSTSDTVGDAGKRGHKAAKRQRKRLAKVT